MSRPRWKFVLPLLGLFSIPGAPNACARAYAKQLTKKATVGKQTVWFQSDSMLTGIF